MKLEPVYLLGPEPDPGPKSSPPRGVSRRLFGLGVLLAATAGFGLGRWGEASLVHNATSERQSWLRGLAAGDLSGLLAHQTDVVVGVTEFPDDEAIWLGVDRLVEHVLADDFAGRRRLARTLAVVATEARYSSPVIARLRQLAR